MKSKWMLVVSFTAAGAASGCGSYYKVTDPHNSNVYYTDNLQRQDSGLVIFKDGKTGQQITLGTSETQKITKDEYNVGRFSPSQSPSASASVAASTAAAGSAAAAPTTRPSSGAAPTTAPVH